MEFNIEHGEFELLLTWSLSSYGLVFLVPAGIWYATKEKSKHQPRSGERDQRITLHNTHNQHKISWGYTNQIIERPVLQKLYLFEERN